MFGCSYTGLPTEVAPVRNPIAANMAVRSRQLREIGGFREGVAPREISYRGVVIAGGHALEDTELGIRIGQRWPEMSWLYQPHATVRHAVTEEQATLGYLMRRSFEEGSSKAHLAGEMGAQSGLSSERRYVSRRPAPRGGPGHLAVVARRSPWRAPLAGDPGRASEQWGRIPRRGPLPHLAATAMTAGRGRVDLHSADFAPSRVIELELGEPLPRLEAESAESGATYAAALCLVRLHGSPLGSVRAEIPPEGLDPDRLASQVQDQLGEEIDRHLRSDGLEPAGRLDASGIRSEARPPCLAQLDDLLQHAPSVSVVIPTRNRPSSLLETLAAFCARTTPATVTS